jgi:hypothetical protein
MPFKHHASRRHHIPKARRRITNWPAYEAGLRRWGDVTFWLDETALSGWRAPRRTSRGGQPIYSNMAIEVVLTGLSRVLDQAAFANCWHGCGSNSRPNPSPSAPL